MKPSFPRSLTKAFLDSHSMLGIVFGALVYLVCFSGTMAVLTDEFARWEQPATPVVESVTGDVLARAATEAFAKARTGGEVANLYVTAPSDIFPQLSVTATGAGPERVWQADATGQLQPDHETPWADFVREQHHSLNIPEPFGGYLVGIIGTLLLGSLISGLLAHRRIIRDAFRLRRGGSPRLRHADLHNRLGVWALPFHLIVALTGSLLGLAGLIIGVLALVAFNGDQEKAIGALVGPQPTADRRAAPLPDIRPMIAEIGRRSPGAPITSVVFQQIGTRGQTVSLTTAERAHLSRNEAWTFSSDGRLLAKAGFTDGTLGMRVYGMITPLHYGTYGGLPLKIIYVLLGAGMTAVVASGVSIWLARRRDQGRAAPIRERLWDGVVWGQPLAYAVSLLAVLVAGMPPIPVYWLAVIATLAAAWLSGSVRRTKMLACVGAGCAILASLAAHIGGQPTLMLLRVGIDLAAACLAALLIWLARPRRMHVSS